MTQHILVTRTISEKMDIVVSKFEVIIQLKL